MSEAVNNQILLSSRPVGVPTRDNFTFIKSSIPEVNDNQLLIRTLYLSVDPYMRGRMNDQKSYIPPFQLDQVITGGVIGEVIETKSSEFQVGDVVLGLLGWQNYSVVDAGEVQKIDTNIAPITTALGVLGMPGMTAYFGLLDIGQPQAGETVVVSGAAGAVGMLVGQIAKIKGARVVGIAGSDDKVQYVTEELGFDAAINYKTTPNMQLALEKACPNGVDVYFDNVGGPISDAVLSLINQGARIPLCGQISLYNSEKQDIGPRVQVQLLKKTATMKGFLVTQYTDRYHEGMTQMAQWIKEGKIKYSENIVEGLENVPEAFLGLFTGENTGKQLVKVSDC
ncbi:NADP-dependent oxidoreductase [Brevibacillus laterosporus]|uniref:NADP-dependent oxidoreductase n=1 Tax=Brevibacillus TaxID=55080 RepID=UPI000BDB77D1|nr:MULTISPECIES: NADP-dependent oxidoreductase [Brevibacillus]AUM65184.1 NADP-dependent oxidoreductase [Brevibacillus laterosporus]MBA4532702.1 NADP-dependent oxidoreductase [Brevibacillus halotolerans]PCN46215.1 NADP-dependent oxidoreductase [Brevibacillus laterosporus]